MNMNPEEEFETIVQQYYEPLFRFALSLARVEADAKDLTQNTFYIWATKGHQLRDRSKVKSWLFSTLHRSFLNAHRVRARFSHHELEEAEDELPPIAPDFENKVDAAQVVDALARVDAVFRGAVSLYYLEEYSQREIAAMLELPIGTVKSRITRGVLQLRALLAGKGDGPSPPAQPEAASLSPANPPAEASEATTLPSAPSRPGKDLSAGPPTEWGFGTTLRLEPLRGLWGHNCGRNALRCVGGR